MHVVNRKKIIITLIIISLLCIAELTKRNGDMIINLMVKSYFYLKTNQTIENERYAVELPFPEWVVAEDYKDYYYAIYKDTINAHIDKIISPISIDYELLTELCEETKLVNKAYIELEGIEIECINPLSNHEILFISSDGYFSMRVIIYEGAIEYENAIALLLNSVRKKNNV